MHKYQFLLMPHLEGSVLLRPLLIICIFFAPCRTRQCSDNFIHGVNHALQKTHFPLQQGALEKLLVDALQPYISTVTTGPQSALDMYCFYVFQYKSKFSYQMAHPIFF